MNPNSSKDNASDLHDSTDWLSTSLGVLSALDASLRCQVCKDFYNTPMITSCSHTFCSLCIRRSLAHDGKCPTCRAGDQEMRLRQNWAVEDQVEAFKSARPEVLEFARRPETRADSPKRKVDEIEDASSPPQKRTRSGRRIQSNPQVFVLDEPDRDDMDYDPEEESRDGLVPCPICQDRMTVQAVEAHIDKCDGISLSKKMAATNTISSSSLRKPATRPERLPHPHYSGLKDTALRKKLTDQGISSSGSRKLLEGRYTEWVTLWNANCDSKSPRGRFELKKELDIWEKTHGGRATFGGRGQITGAQIKDKDFDGKAWADKNVDAFNELIANARKPVAKAVVPEPAVTQGDAAEASTLAPADLTVLNEQPGGAEPQINTQINTQQAPPLDLTAAIQPEQHQSKPILNSDTATSPDIDTTKPLQM